MPQALPGSPGTRIKVQLPCRYLLGVSSNEQRECPSLVPDSCVSSDRLHSQHISLVKAHHGAAAKFRGSGGEPDILGGPYEGHHMVPINLGDFSGVKERNGHW